MFKNKYLINFSLINLVLNLIFCAIPLAPSREITPGAFISSGNGLYAIDDTSAFTTCDTIHTGDTLNFIGTISGPDLLVNGKYWNLGDGTIDTQSVVRHFYEKSGTYTAVFSIFSQTGDTLSDTVTVFVNTPPESVTISSPVDGVVNQNVSPVFSWKSYDADTFDSLLEYSIRIWDSMKTIDTVIEWIDTNSLTLDGSFKRGTTVRWFVTARDFFGDEASTDTASFSILPGVKSLIINGDTVTGESDNFNAPFTDTINGDVAIVDLSLTEKKSPIAILVNDSLIEIVDGVIRLSLIDTINNFDVTTITEDSTRITCPIRIVRIVSDNAMLSSLKISEGGLYPDFSESTFDYSDTVSENITSVTILPTAADSTATISINGKKIQSGTASKSITIDQDSVNTVLVEVTAQDGATRKQYSITIIPNRKSEVDSSDSTVDVVVIPTKIVAEGKDTSTIILTWNDNNNYETGYSINRSMDKDSGYVEIATTGANETYYTDTALVSGTQYHYFIRSLYGNKQSDKSPIVSSFTRVILTLSSNYDSYGTVLNSPDQRLFCLGDTVSINAIPNSGYHFKNWSGDIKSDDNPIMFSINCNKNIVGIFKIDSTPSPDTVHYRPVYKLTLLTEGNGTTDPEGTIEVDSGTGTSITAIPSKGYRFIEWRNLNGKAEIDNVNINPGTVTLLDGKSSVAAIFEIQCYTVRFNSQGGSSINPQTVNNGDIIPEPTAPEKECYSFMEWFKDSACTTAWDFDNGKVLEDMILYAKWTIDSFTITFDSQEGTAVPDTIVACGSNVNEPNPPSKPGYSFEGWYQDSGRTILWVFTSAEVTDDITLYANWTANPYNITFDNNDAETSGSMPVQTIFCGATVNLNTNGFIKPCWTFDGWATTSTGPVEYTDGQSYTMGTENVTLYAKWRVNTYTVSFNKNDPEAIGSMDDQQIACGSTANLNTNGFTKSCWSFAGWATTPTGAVEYTDGQNYPMGEANVTLYAKWTANQYTITFNKNDPEAIGSMDDQQIACGSTANLNTNGFTKSCWSFAGWATTPTGAVEYTDGEPYTMGEANVTLYAKWTANQYTITFNKNDPDAIGSMADQTIVCGSTVQLDSRFTKPCWTFYGWAATPTGPVEYTDGEHYVVTANITLYAKWRVDTYIINFNKNDPYANGSMGYQMISCGSTANLNANGFTKSCSSFDGWATTSTGPVVYANNALFTMGSSNVTLYAKWTVIEDPSYPELPVSISGPGIIPPPDGRPFSWKVNYPDDVQILSIHWTVQRGSDQPFSIDNRTEISFSPGANNTVTQINVTVKAPCYSSGSAHYTVRTRFEGYPY